MTSAPDGSVSLSGAGRESPIAAVSLDIDDTLLDSDMASRAGLRALVGNDRAWQVWRAVTHRYQERCFAGEFDFDSMRALRTRAFFAEFGEHIDESEAWRRERVRAAAMCQQWQLFDDARPCLDWLRDSGMRVVVVTNAPGRYQRAKIAALGLDSRFDALVISGEVGVRKPDPRIFHSASAAVGVAPERMAHIGDRLSTDAVGSMRAGMRGIWLNRSRSGYPPPSIPMITSLHELPSLLCEVRPDDGSRRSCAMLAGANT